MLEVCETDDLDLVRRLLETYHPLSVGGALRGKRYAFVGYEDGWPVFCALFTTPRARWRKRNVVLELSRLVFSPCAQRSASTFLTRCLRELKKRGVRGEIVTYALPCTMGQVYTRSGFVEHGHSSGASWAVRGGGELRVRKPRPPTVGTGKRLRRFFYMIE